MHESIILALLKGLNVGEERFRSHLEEASKNQPAIEEAPKNQPAIEEASPAQMEHEDTTAPAETPLEGASGSFWNIEGDKNP
jgi:hypothetical protein